MPDMCVDLLDLAMIRLCVGLLLLLCGIIVVRFGIAAFARLLAVVICFHF